MALLRSCVYAPHIRDWFYQNSWSMVPVREVCIQKSQIEEMLMIRQLMGWD